jgi:hypothetical protein
MGDTQDNGRSNQDKNKHFPKLRSLILKWRLKNARRSALLGPGTPKKLDTDNPITPDRVALSPNQTTAITNTGTRLRPVHQFHYSQSHSILWQPAGSPEKRVHFLNSAQILPLEDGPQLNRIILTHARLQSWLTEKRSNWPSQQSVMRGSAKDEAALIGLNVSNYSFEWGHLVAFMFGGPDGQNPQVDTNLLAMTAFGNSEMLAIFESPVCKFILENPTLTVYLDVIAKKYKDSRVAHSIQMRVYTDGTDLQHQGVRVTIDCLTLRQPDMSLLAAMKVNLDNTLLPQTVAPKRRVQSLFSNV